MFIGLLKNEAHLNEEKVICKPKLREWSPTLLLFIVLCNVAVYKPDHSQPVIGGRPSRASLDSDNYSLLHYKQTISR